VIAGFDHVVIAVNDIAAAAPAYESLLGREASGREARDGVATNPIVLDNIAVELIAPTGDGEMARRLRTTLEAGEGLKSVVFATADIERAHRRYERLGLQPEAIATGPTARSFRLNTQLTRGVRIFILERDEPVTPAPKAAASVLGLDHVVIRSSDMERAAALYGARLGLDMRLDREVAGRRLMFFRCGDAVVEIAHDPAREADLLWGLSWRVADADAMRERLAGAGVNVSEVRQGMKPGTRVFTVRDGTCNVPTLMVEQGAYTATFDQ
jgi:catechol 2,3-dioxygenase-like lactoylglutathione lyase family enzyme